MDADADGLLDIAVPCKNSDEVVVLLAPAPGLQRGAALRGGLATARRRGGRPRQDGDLDLAVANTVGNSVSVLSNADGYGTFAAGPVLGLPGGAPTAVVAADFDRDNILDLAANDAGGGRGAGVPRARRRHVRDDGLVLPRRIAAGRSGRRRRGPGRKGRPAGSQQDCPGTVSLLRNLSSPGTVSFSDPTNPALPDDDFDVGDNPTAIFVADLDGDEHLDFAVANDALAGPDA